VSSQGHIPIPAMYNPFMYSPLVHVSMTDGSHLCSSPSQSASNQPGSGSSVSQASCYLGEKSFAHFSVFSENSRKCYILLKSYL
jgi:hypothetical protein